MNLSTTILFLAATLALAQEARAAVPCMAASSNAQSAWSQLHVRRDEVKPGRVLLGRDGARIGVKDTLAPVAASEPGAGLPWQERVDWKKHEIGASHSAAAAALFFDTDEQGKRYLCRIEKRAVTEAYSRRNSNAAPAAVPEPADIRVVERTDLRYDARNRLGSVVNWQWDGARLKRNDTACFHYDQAGRYIGTSSPDAASCTGPGPARIAERYVYAGGGKLLRKISIEKRMAGLDGKPFVTSAARVVVYDAQDRPKAEYVEDEARRHYRRSLPGHAPPRDYQAVKLVGSPAAINVNTLLGGESPGFWQFHAIPIALANGDDMLGEQKYLIASGDKRAISSAERDQIWQALNRPDHDLRYQGQEVFLLVPDVAAPRWAACMDELRNTPGACP